MHLVKVRYYSQTTGELGGREYTYYSVDTLSPGDIVSVPVRDTISKARVTQVNIPDTEVEAFRDKIKFIPAGSKYERIPKEDAGGNQKRIEPLPPLSDRTPPIAIPKDLIESVENESNDLIVDLNALFPGNEITDEETLNQASDALTRINQWIKNAEQTRAELVHPGNTFVRQVNAMFKKFVDPVKKEDVRIRHMMGTFRAKVQAERRAQYEEAKQHVGEAFPDGSPIPETVAPIPEDTLNRVQTDHGSVNFTTIWKWSIVDFDTIPREYFVLDEARITKLVKAGLRTIPGIKVYSEEVPAVRANG